MKNIHRTEPVKYILFCENTKFKFSLNTMIIYIYNIYVKIWIYKKYLSKRKNQLFL